MCACACWFGCGNVGVRLRSVENAGESSLLRARKGQSYRYIYIYIYISTSLHDINGLAFYAVYHGLRIGAKYAYVHDGHCAGGFLGGNTCQPSLKACADNCANNKECGYFAYQPSCDGGTNCALYDDASGCPDDNQYPKYNAYRIERGWSCQAEKIMCI